MSDFSRSNAMWALCRAGNPIRLQAAAAPITETHGSLDLLKNYNIACILLHPGTVDTNLSRPFQRNVPRDKLFMREFSVQKLLSIIDNVKKSNNDKLYDQPI